MSYEQINEIKKVVLENYIKLLKEDETISQNPEVLKVIDTKAKEYLEKNNG